MLRSRMRRQWVVHSCFAVVEAAARSLRLSHGFVRSRLDSVEEDVSKGAYERTTESKSIITPARTCLHEYLPILRVHRNAERM